jgi:hypothetical protein
MLPEREVGILGISPLLLPHGGERKKSEEETESEKESCFHFVFGFFRV